MGKEMAEWKVIHSEILLNSVSQINDRFLNTTVNYGPLYPYAQNFLTLCGRIKRLCEVGEIDKETFNSGLLSRLLDPIILWIICNCEFINENDYFNEQCKTKQTWNDFMSRLAELSLSNGKVALKERACGDLIKSLDVYCCKAKKDKLIESFARECFNVVCEFAENADLKIETLRNFMRGCSVEFREATYKGLLGRAIIEAGEHVMEVISTVDKYRPRSDYIVKQVLLLVVKEVSLHDNLNHVRAIVTESLDNGINLNWNHIAQLVRCLSSVSKEYVSPYKSMVNEIIVNSLNNTNSVQLYAAIIFGRILCLDELATGISYLQWHSLTFSSESSRPLNTEGKAKFFLRAMTNLLDMEPSYCLKAHVHKAFSVPASCQGDLAEYLQLAKARLLSLNESIEMGFFDNKRGGSAPVNDVLCLVKQFEDTGKISSTFLASTTFRRLYYEKTFVPALFATCPGRTSTQHSLLKKLLDLGKISKIAFKKHEDDCLNG